MAKQDINVYVPIQKVDDEQRLVSGICTSEALDSHGEIVSSKAIKKAWAEYMEYANVREMHQASAVGVTKEYEHQDKGTYITVKVVDDRAWKFVKEGVYKGFSIGGRVTKKSGNIIEGLILAEISLVDRPACPDAKFDAIKVDGALVDALQLREDNKEKSMHKFIDIEGTKYKEDPEKPGEVLLDTEGNKVPFTAEDEAAAAAAAADAAPDAPAPEAPAPDAPAPDAPAPDAPAPDAPAPVENAAPVADLKKAAAEYLETHKDTLGTITLAAALDHLDYIRCVFEMNDKETDGVKKIMDVIKEMIAKEAAETDKGAKPADLAKVFGSELSKAVAPILEEVKGARSDVSSLEKRVAAIEGTKVSPRPAGAARPVEKTVETQVASTGSKALLEKRAELETISKEIDEHHAAMKGILDSSEMAKAQAKGLELFTKYQNCKREVESLAAGQ